MENVPKTIQYLVEAECVAAEILSLKEQILNLHKKMNETREALAVVSKSDFTRGYMYEGALLMQQSREDMINKLKADFKEINEEIRVKGDEMKEKVFKLQDIEKQAPYSGKSLVPLDRNELSALSQVWGLHST